MSWASYKQERGLGDFIENRITRPTGLKAVVDAVSKGLNVPCGCEGRKEALNRMLPFNKNK